MVSQIAPPNAIPHFPLQAATFGEGRSVDGRRSVFPNAPSRWIPRLRLDLAMAMEDHDLNRIKRFLPVAQNLGVAPEVGLWDAT